MSNLSSILDAVNLILRKLGEPPIGSLNTQYPTLDLILPALDEAQRNLLAEGWWFNKFEPVTLHPNASNRVVVPPDTMVFEPYKADYLFTGEFIRLADGALEITTPVQGMRIANLPFEELPLVARTAVVYSAAMAVYAADVGIDDIYQDIQRNYAQAYQELGATHTRQRKYSVRRKKQVQRWHYYLRS